MSPRMNRMQALVELAETELDKTAQTLAVIRAQHAEALTQLEALTSYAKEYGQVSTNQSTLISPIQLQTRHAFGEKLGQAVVAQTIQVDELVDTVESARQSWLEKRVRVKALQALLDKLKLGAQIKLDKQEQHMMDELAAQSVILRRADSTL
ncbi:flagellar export protein FliJ [Thiomicrorhabdus arctica]|uniref:flagellar export protein FliJ n=1 Tax=Thiomicrorhabdus arctica TaxID=131540 RepID=UPI0012FE4C99|nr:flagellar export protein FliJ [Thiomicrorhabdus arctica]